MIQKNIYAGFWKRLIAYLVDYIILSIIGYLYIIIFGEIFAVILGIFVYWIYAAILESSEYGATIGKMLFKIKVVDLNGKQISFGRATGRHFGKIISGFIFCIGYIMIIFTKKKQGLHDKIANCLVINKNNN